MWGFFVGAIALLLGCGGADFQRACIDTPPGTPLAAAARRLEAAGGEPRQGGTENVKVWTGRRVVRTPYCNVGFDKELKVQWTYFGKAWILP